MRCDDLAPVLGLCSAEAPHSKRHCAPSRPGE